MEVELGDWLPNFAIVTLVLHQLIAIACKDAITLFGNAGSRR